MTSPRLLAAQDLVASPDPTLGPADDDPAAAALGSTPDAVPSTP